MKVFVAILVIAIAATTMALKKPDFNGPEFKAGREECAKENGVDLSALMKMKEEKKIDMTVMEDPKTKCFFKCVMGKYGLLNDDGEPNIDKIMEKFEIADGSDAMKAAKECIEKHKQADVCDKVYQRTKCIMHTMKTKM